ncbi:TY-Chap domain-containing protein [Acrocarpospora pleiomorpha]|nr:hypothetical protein [Acrocarpospora pleiomorpha]
MSNRVVDGLPLQRDTLRLALDAGDRVRTFAFEPLPLVVRCRTSADTFGQGLSVDHGPDIEDLDLESVTTREDLAVALRELHVRADSPSLRYLERWAASHQGAAALSKATVSDMLRGIRFPRRAVLETFVEACGVPAQQLAPWRRAWTKIASKEKYRAVDEIAEAQRLREQVLSEARQHAAAIIAVAEARAHQIIIAAAAEAGIELPDPGIQLDGAWAVFRRGILSRLPTAPGEVLLIRDRIEHRRYVQVWWQVDGFHAETPNSHVIKGVTEEMLLTASDEQALADAGWQQPFRDVIQYNWWINLAHTSSETMATMAVAALHKVQKVESTSTLEFLASRDPNQLGSGVSESAWESAWPSLDGEQANPKSKDDPPEATAKPT